MSIYEDIFIRTLFKRPLRLISIAYHAFISGPTTGKPFKVKFESSTICNLKCVMCPLTKGLTRKTGVLKFENFKKVYDEIKFPYVNLTGLGEPLINPDIFKIIRYARKNKSFVKIDTNAMLLNEENIKKLIQSNPTFISVSIDGASKKTYESIRKGGDFNRVITNLKKLVEYRNKIKSNTEIHLFFVLQKSNFKELADFIKLGDSMGVDSINGNIAISFGKIDNKNKREIDRIGIEKLKSELELLKKQIKAKLDIANIEDFLNNPENQIEKSTKKPCYYPWYNPCISWDGYVVPCDIHCDNEIVFGNAFKEPFMKIWNNKKAQDFRMRLLNKRQGVCAKCCVDESMIFDKYRVFYKIPLIRNLPHRKLK